MKSVLPLAVLSLALGYLLYGSPLGTDAVSSWQPVVGAFFLFIFWLCSLVSVGELGTRYLQLPRHILYVLWLGSLAMSLALFVLALLHLASFQYLYLHLFLLLVPCAASFWLRLKKPKNLESITVLDTWLDTWLAALPALALAVLVMTLGALTFFPDSAFDPLAYHLVAARIWAEAGTFTLPANNAGVYGASYWEHLYVWGQILLGGEQGTGLIAAQCFGQWTHFFLGFLGAMLALARIFRKLFPKISMHALLLVVFAALCSNSLLPVSQIAKNDWGQAFWILGAVALFIENKNKIHLVFFALGIAIMSKLSALPLVALLAAWMLWELNDRKKIISCGLYLLAGMLPILLRNGWVTGNPFFPILNGIFPSKQLGPTWREMQHYEGGLRSIEVTRIWVRSFTFVKENPFNLTFLAAPFAFKKNISASRLALVLLIAYIFYALILGSRAEPRLFGAGFLLIGGLGMLVVVDFLSRRKYFEWPLVVGSLLVLGCCTHLPWIAPSILGQMETPSREINKFDTGEALLWLRNHLEPKDRIVSVSEPRLYYLLPWKMVRVWDDAELDRATAAAATPRALYEALAANGVTHVLITHMLLDQYFNRQVWEWVNATSQRYSEALVYSSATARIILVQAMLKQLKDR